MRANSHTIQFNQLKVYNSVLILFAHSHTFSRSHGNYIKGAIWITVYDLCIFFSTRREDFLEQRLFFSSLYLLNCNKNAPCVCLLEMNCKWDNPIKTILETRTGYLHGQTKHLWYCKPGGSRGSESRKPNFRKLYHSWAMEPWAIKPWFFFFFLKSHNWTEEPLDIISKTILYLS